MTLSAIPIYMLIWTAAAWDLNQRRIPNILVFIGAIVGTVLQLVLAGLSGLLDALAGLGVGLVILMPGYLAGSTGAGDAKLMAAIGTFLGPYNILVAGLASVTVGAVVAVGFITLAIFADNSQAPWRRYGLMLKTLFVTGRPIYLAPTDGEVMGRKFPFAVSIALGTTLFLIWQSPLVSQVN